jgi:hypothetical protein
MALPDVEAMFSSVSEVIELRQTLVPGGAFQMQWPYSTMECGLSSSLMHSTGFWSLVMS